MRPAMTSPRVGTACAAAMAWCTAAHGVPGFRRVARLHCSFRPAALLMRWVVELVQSLFNSRQHSLHTVCHFS